MNKQIVLFAGYPRSGMHWILNMYKLVTGGDRHWSKPGKPYLYDGAPVFVKTHKLPKNLGDAKKHRIVYGFRHGKDAILAHSKFMHSKYFHSGRYNKSYSTDWLKYCIVEECLAVNWARHVESFFLVGQNPRCEFFPIKFEDMLKDPVRKLKRIIEFAGIGSPDRVTRKAIRPYLAKGLKKNRVVLWGKKEGPQVEGYVSGVPNLIYGEATARERLAVFTERWRTFKYWTAEIDDIVNRQIGSVLKKYGYEL